MKRSPMPPRSAPLRARSLKALRRIPADIAWRTAVLERDGYCRAAGLIRDVPCWGKHTAHHVGQVSTHPHLRHVVANGVRTCARHHDWIHDHIADAEADARDAYRAGDFDARDGAALA